MRKFGYARVGLSEVESGNQREILNKYSVDQVFADVGAGVKDQHPELKALLSEVRAGDSVVVTSFDRLAMNTHQLLELTETLEERRVFLSVLDCELDTSSDAGKKMLAMLKTIVNLEKSLVTERQAEGIARAKSEGKYLGRKPTARAKSQQIIELAGQGMTRQAIAERLSIGVASVYRVLRDHRETGTVQVVEQITEPKPVRKVAAKKPAETKEKSSVKPKAENKSAEKAKLIAEDKPLVKEKSQKKAAKPKKKTADEADQFMLPF